jgi:hypothetical protein
MPLKPVYALGANHLFDGDSRRNISTALGVSKLGPLRITTDLCPPVVGDYGLGPGSGFSEGKSMKTWHKVTIGVAAVAALGAIVLISINQAN